MPKRAERKRKERRMRSLENDINENGLDHRPGQFRVFDRKSRQYITQPLNWEEAVKIWQEQDNCIILDSKYTRKGK